MIESDKESDVEYDIIYDMIAISTVKPDYSGAGAHSFRNRDNAGEEWDKTF